MSEPHLRLQALSLAFEGVQALQDVSLDVERGEVYSLIGPNGAGKTSIINCIAGTQRPSRGRIWLNGRDITSMKPHRIAALGVARTFQNVDAFNTMTVIDNLLLGRFNKTRTGVTAGMVWIGKALREEIGERRRIEEVVDYLELHAIRHHVVGSLPVGLRKRVELGRTLAMDPEILLLDEPTSGTNREETEDMVRVLLDIRDELGITLVLVEHDMGVVMDISDRVCVLDHGHTVAIGAPEHIGRNTSVRLTYLGR